MYLLDLPLRQITAPEKNETTMHNKASLLVCKYKLPNYTNNISIGTKEIPD
jgi:hypothetical protein